MSTTTYNIPIELTTTGGYTISELKEKLMAYAVRLVSMPKQEPKPTTKTKEHSAWVQSMAKYRRLDPVD